MKASNSAYAVENMSFTLRAMAALRTSRSIFFDDGGFAFAAGADSASVNWAFFPPVLSRVINEKKVQRVRSFFDDLKLPFLWPVFPKSDYGRILEKAGMLLLGERLVMVCQEFSPIHETGAASDVLTFEINKDADVWAETACKAFGYQPGAHASLFNLARGLRENKNFSLILVKKNGTPVGTAMLTSGGGKNAGIYYFATLPSERGNGVGEAMLREAGRLASRYGCDVITLDATPAGAMFYASRGFEPLFRLPFYSVSQNHVQSPDA